MRSVYVVHPGSSVSTSDVHDGLCAGLRAQGVHVDEYRTDVQIAQHGRLLQWMWEDAGHPPEKYTSTDVIYKASKELLLDASRARRLHGTTWVIVVSGMYQHPDTLVYLRDAGFHVAVLLTESPYDAEHELEAIDRRKVTGATETVANVVFTNERTSVAALRQVQPRSYYLPHAWNPARLTDLPTGPEAAQIPTHDVVFVGTYFEERVRFLADVDWTDIRLGLYGTTEEIRAMAQAPGPSYLPEFARRACESPAKVTDLQRDARRLERHIRGGYVPNPATQALYRNATVGLNFHRTSKGYLTGQHIATAESLNPRCYELAAAGCFFVSDPRAELADVLPMVPTFQTAMGCEDVIRRALADPAWRAEVAAAAREAVQPHSWTARAGHVIKALEDASARTRVA